MDFLNGQRLLGPLEIEQAAQRAKVLGLVVHQFRIFLEDFVASEAATDLQFVNRLRIEQMILAIRAPLILAASASSATRR